MSIKGDDKQSIEQLIQKLHPQGKLIPKWVKQGSHAYRVQGIRHKKAENYRCPKWPEELGRYNDPQEEIGIWYGAQNPCAALAETFGRLRPRASKGAGIFINVTDLGSRTMCVVEMDRDLKLLDLKLCLSKLARTIDEVSGADYTLTQEIVRVVSRLPGNPFDGIAYESRHHPDGSSCYALWSKPGEATTVRTVEVTKLSDFEYQGAFPEGFGDDSLDTEEIMTEILGYKVLGF